MLDLNKVRDIDVRNLERLWVIFLSAYSIIKIRMFPKTSFFLTTFLPKSLWESKLFENSYQRPLV